MIVGATAIYLATAGALALGGIAVAGIALRETGRRRKILLVAAVPPIAMAGAYVGMGLELFTITTNGREQSVARYVGYSMVNLAFAVIVTRLVSLSSRQFATLFIVLLLSPWTSLLSWVVSGPLGTILTVSPIGAFLLGAYWLFGPVTRLGTQVSRERQLLYSKLRNLYVLVTGMLIVQAAISEQSLGLTDLFVGQLTASYTDLIFLLGIAGILVAGREIFDGADAASQ